MSNKTMNDSMTRPRERNSFRTSLWGGSKNRFFRTCLLLVCLFVCSHFAQGQSDPNVQFTQGDVNESATLSLGVPLGHYKGRGLDLPISLSYSSNTWRIEQIGKIHNYEWSPPFYVVQSVTRAIYAEHSVAGWKSTLDLPKIEFPKQSDAYDYRARPYPSATWQGCFGYRISRLFIHMPEGSTHEFRKSDQPSYSDNIDRVGTFYAVDGSRMRYDSTGVDTGTLYLPDGTRYVLGHPTSSIIDRNGNTQTFDETTRRWTDTLGRVIVNPLPPTTFDQPQDYNYDLPGLNGGSMTYTFKWRNLSDSLTPNADGSTPTLRYMASHYLPNPNLPPNNTGQGNSPVPQSSQYQSLFQTATVYDPDGFPGVPIIVVGKGQSGGQLFNPVVLQEIVLPGGTSYKFSYNVYGELDKVTYPTTAYEKYEYASSVAEADQDQQPYIQAQRRVTSRQLSINGLGTDSLEWKYLETVPSALLGNPVDNHRYRVISIIAPDKTRTEIFKYDPLPNDGTGRQYWAFGFANSLQGLVFQKRYFSSSKDGLGGQLLRREITQYEQKINNYQFAVTCGQSPFTRTISAYRNPRPVKRVMIAFEGSGSALAQTSTFAYDPTDDMRTGVDQILAATHHFAVLDNNTAQTGTLSQIPTGNIAKYSETSYLHDLNYQNPSPSNAKHILGLVTRAKLKTGNGAVILPDDPVVSQSEIRYDESGYSPEVGRALPSSSRVWDNTKGAAENPNAYLTTRAKFDIYGNRVEAIDAMGNVTRTEYDPTYNAFPTKVITPAPDPNSSQNPDGQAHGSNTGFETITNYDPTTGLVLSVMDANGQITQMEYNDPFLRISRVIPPSGGAQMITEYGLGNSESTRYVKVKKQIDENNWEETTSFYDGVGRTYKTQNRDSNGDIFTETQYDHMGRVKQVSNPYREGEARVWTSTDYDDLSRPIRVTAPDGSQVQTAYGFSTAGIIGVSKTNTDQTNHQRQGIKDALGRMIRVIEDPGGQNLSTDYVYDTLGNLRRTIQGEQNRYFMYDSLGRVLYLKQPEQDANLSLNATDSITGNTQWALKFTYDDNGNIVATTDARNINTVVTYDRLNRPIYRNYSDATADVSFYYDGTGLAQVPGYSKNRTTKVSSSVSETRYTAFDNFGRIKSSQQITNGRTYNFPDYSYDVAGKLKSQTYPSGRVVTNQFDDNGDLASVSGQNPNQQANIYISQIKYSASGFVKEARLGNGRFETAAYNDRLQITQIGLGYSSADSSLLKIEFDYGAAPQNNGALKQQRINYTGLASQIVQNYTYDNLNRLKSSVETFGSGAQSWKQTFSYDRFGNRRFDAANTTTINSSAAPKVTNPLINTLDNRLQKDQDGDNVTDYDYDKAGNLTRDAENSRFVYDAENRQTQFFNGANSTTSPDATYFYDGEGHRVRKISGALDTIFVYNAANQLIAEYSNQLPENPKISYLTADHLGSPRVITDQSGQVVSRHDYMGFGEEISAGYANRTIAQGYGARDEISKQFTGYERDTESGLDYAQARYYNSRHGRFTSVDPALLSINGFNPQTWNRYAYVINSPYVFVDPLGLWALYFIPVYKKDKEGKDTKEIDHYIAIAVQTQPNDDAASLAKQLGLKGNEAKDFVKSFGEKVEKKKVTSNNVELAKLGGATGRVFGFVQDLYSDQKEYERKHGSNQNGPTNTTDTGQGRFSDCSTTSITLHTSSANANARNWDVKRMDDYIKDNLSSIAAGDLRIGDVVRYALDVTNNKGEVTQRNAPKHFTTFIFMNDDGEPIVFSRNGEGGNFAYGKATDFQYKNYGTIRGAENKDTTGFYGKKK